MRAPALHQLFAIGYNSCIDVAKATRRGVVVDGATSVAEHALAMVLVAL